MLLEESSIFCLLLVEPPPFLLIFRLYAKRIRPHLVLFVFR